MSLDELFKRHSINCDYRGEFSKREGFHVCPACGLCTEPEFVDQSRRAYSLSERDNRTQNSRVFKSHAYRTVFNKKKDVNDKPFNGEKKALMNRLLKLQKSTFKKCETNYNKRDVTFIHFKDFAPKSVLSTGLRIYNNCYKKNLTQGRSIEGLVISSIYAAMRVEGHPVFLDQFVKESDFDIKPNKIMKYLHTMIKYDVFKDLDYKLQPPVIPWGQVETDLGITTREVNSIKNMIDDLPKTYLMGKDIKGVIAGAAYLHLKDTPEKKTQKELAEVFGITEVTLRSRCKKLKNS